ncbi:MAG: serpin family protein [Balneolaceae bacterium]|nr:serpin family protein [Balneolaceae bacterium]
MNRLTFLVLFVLGAAQFACDTTNVPQFDEEAQKAKTKLLKADQNFSLDLFSAVHEGDSLAENIFISPLSASMALGMTMNGAAGNTYAEMQEALGFEDLSTEEINKGYQALKYELEHADEKVEMAIANSVWSKQGFEVNPEFFNTVEEYFEAETASLDFNNPKTLERINGWVADKTNDRIKKIIEKIGENDVMYLINAVYFNGPWKYEFDPEFTGDREFYVDENNTVMVEMMNQNAEVGYLINDEVEMVELPYGNDKFSALFIKPGANYSSVDEMIQSELNATQLEAWISDLNVGQVRYLIPKITLEYKRQLISDLQALGIFDLFNEGSADLSNLFSDINNLYVSSVLQKTFLKMNEEGTEAAAVTAVTVGVESVGESWPTIIYDEPYLLLLREKETGAILFIGKIGNPVAE